MVVAPLDKLTYAPLLVDLDFRLHMCSHIYTIGGARIILGVILRAKQEIHGPVAVSLAVAASNVGVSTYRFA